ncbi:PAS domain S-box-containing protein [Chitinophaga costaii]|uniref:histidine kinase n=1 Tax=Chitinophaga costaii TaxID=1335309 RepID=A0A1C4CNG0_9BACT|nr:PAS domain S-box protein [Chitinophaga costaii]PUZ27018.1 PAS domain S-box protein [Chitinophaga costaii]SCC20635.1 PAS domain S-box-containing protein [Chitinophaga costaii]
MGSEGEKITALQLNIRKVEAELEALRQQLAAQQHVATVLPAGMLPLTPNTAMLAMMMEQAKHLIMIKGLDNRIIWMSPSFLEFTGYTLEEVLGQNPLELLSSHKDRISVKALDYMAHQMATSLEYEGEYEGCKKNGEPYWVKTTAQPVRDEQGAVLHYLSISEDVTEKVASRRWVEQMQRKLEQDSNRLFSVLSNLHEAILLEDQQGNTQLVNDTFCHLFGIHRDAQFLLQRATKIVWRALANKFNDPTAFLPGIDNLVQHQETVLNEILLLNDQRILERDYILINEGQHFLGTLWRFRDVTEQVRAGEKLKSSEEKYRNIIENMNLGLLETDNQENILYANQRFCDITGYTLDDLIGRSVYSILLRGENVSLMREKNVLRKKGVSDAYEIRTRDRRGHVKWLLISGAPLYDDKHVQTGAINIHLDITAQKKLEVELREANLKAEESSKAKEIFFANMSHEIRTPMNGILGMSELMQQTPLNEQQEGYLKVIHRSAENLLVIINDILDFSKMEAGKLQLKEVNFDLFELVYQMQATMQPHLKEKNLLLEVKLTDQTPQFLKGDPYRLNQILLNLVNNAVKFTDLGWVKVSIRTTLLDDGVRLFFEVKDTGIGISKDYLDRVFQSFSQEDGTGTREYGGTGLGLAITRQLIGLMGGQISIESEKHKGTTVYFDLTFKTGEAPAPKEAVFSKPADELKRVRVLVVEDNEFNRLVAGSLLRNHGATVLEATDGRQALNVLLGNDVDVVLMDIQMPVMNGYDAAKHIRKDLRLQIPIIALTANALQGEREKCLQAGMNEWLVKPVNEEELISTILRLLGKVGNQRVNALEPAMAAHNNSPLYSLAGLQKMAGNNTAFIKRMISVFMDITPPYIRDLEKAILAKDLSTIKSVVHKMRPSIHNLSIIKLYTLIEDLESREVWQEDVATRTALLNETLQEVMTKMGQETILQ